MGTATGLRCGWLGLCVACCLGRPAPAGDSPQVDWERWVQQRDERIKTSPTSFLSVEDAVYVEPGEAAYLAEAAEPGGRKFLRAKPSAALLAVQFDGRRAPLSMGDAPVIDLLEARTHALPGGLILAADRLGDGALRLRLHNPQHPALRAFEGLLYFPFDPAARVTARFVRAQTPEAFYFETVRGRKTQALLVGRVEFDHQGQPASLKAYTLDSGPDAHALFVPFRDATTGAETYPTGRYLDVDLPNGLDSSEVLLDFNRATNPLCARSPYYNCVRVADPPLDFPVRAGERGGSSMGSPSHPGDNLQNPDRQAP